MSTKLYVHVVDQAVQPYGSASRCCNRCGVMADDDMLFVTSTAVWENVAGNCHSVDPKACPACGGRGKHLGVCALDKANMAAPYQASAIPFGPGVDPATNALGCLAAWPTMPSIGTPEQDQAVFDGLVANVKKEMERLRSLAFADCPGATGICTGTPCECLPFREEVARLTVDLGLARSNHQADVSGMASLRKVVRHQLVKAMQLANLDAGVDDGVALSRTWLDGVMHYLENQPQEE